MGRVLIVAPAADWRVDPHQIGLWIVPDLWKTFRSRFPRGPWKTLRVFHTLHRPSTSWVGSRRTDNACARDRVYAILTPLAAWPVLKRSSVAGFERSVTRGAPEFRSTRPVTPPSSITP